MILRSILLFALLWTAAESKNKLTVFLPATIRWNDVNEITVIKPTGPETRVLFEVSAKKTRSSTSSVIDSDKVWSNERDPTCVFKFNSSSSGEAAEYLIKISTENPGQYEDFEAVLYGEPRLQSVAIFTDKGHYRDGETINIRALPLADDGTLYRDSVRIFLESPLAFRVDSVEASIGGDDGFIRASLTVPTHAANGTWRVVAYPSSSLQFPVGSVKIKVEDYVLPPFFVSIVLSDGKNDGYALIDIYANYPNGKPVSRGTATIFCDTGSAKPKKLGSVQLRDNGTARSEISVAGCAVLDQRLGTIRTTTTVLDGEMNDESVSVQREFRRNLPHFQIVPLRPFFDDHTKKIQLYFKATRRDVSGTVSGSATCISANLSITNLDQKLETTIGGVAEFNVSSGCNVYIINASRRSSDATSLGTSASAEIFLTVPNVAHPSLELDLIKPLSQVVYRVGELFRARVVVGHTFAVICNRETIVAAGSIPSTSKMIEFAVDVRMKGFCVLHVVQYSHLDVMLFFVEDSPCSSGEFGIQTSSRYLNPPEDLNVTLTAPVASLAVVRALDKRLLEILQDLLAVSWRQVTYWNMFTFLTPSRDNIPRILNLVDPVELLKKLQNSCEVAGEQSPQNPFETLPTGQEVAEISAMCMHVFNESYIRKKTKDDIRMQAVNHHESSPSMISSMHAQVLTLRTGPTTARTHIKSYIFADLANSIPFELNDPPPTFQDNVFLRSFFPEVWFFDDIVFKDTQVTLTLPSPHSVGQWAIGAHIWHPVNREICSLPLIEVQTLRHVYMEIEAPTHVYQNETVPFRIIVRADNLYTRRSFSLCFTSISPVVCSDMGVDGNMGAAEFMRMEVAPNQVRTEKVVHVNFFQTGPQNVSFEFREEPDVHGETKNQCTLPNAHVYDRIVKTIFVEERFDYSEAYNQVVVYPTRQLNTLFETSTPKSFIPDDISIIQFKQRKVTDNTVEATVNIVPTLDVVQLHVELAEQTPSYPLGTGSTERRVRRSFDDYDFQNAVMDYTFAVYDRKQAILEGKITLDSLAEEHSMTQLGEYRMNVYKYFNCTSNKEEACGFTEFGSISPLYTALVASLTCEEDVEQVDDIVCGPLYYLANFTAAGTEINESFTGQIPFKSKSDLNWFLKAAIMQTFSDCALKTCMDNIRPVVEQLHEEFYKFTVDQTDDLRVIAIIASTTFRLVGQNLRYRIHDSANVDQMPYWQLPSTDNNNILEQESDVVKSTNIMVNSLALLAFVNQSDTVYDHYRSKMNLPALADWLTEEQNHPTRFQTVVDSFYAWRTLYRYSERVRGKPTRTPFTVKLMVPNTHARSFNANDMPMSLRLPANLSSFKVEMTGGGRLIMGVRVLHKPKKRSKRDEEDNPVWSVVATQKRPELDNQVAQRVCVNSTSWIEHFRVRHYIYTAFRKVRFEPESNSVEIFNLHETPNYIGFGVRYVNPPPPHKPVFRKVCYNVVLNESSIYSVEQQAPVPVIIYTNQLQHEILLRVVDIVGNERLRRRKRRTYHVHRGHLVSRRDTQADAFIDAVCLEHGNCVCAELTCALQNCMPCNRTTDTTALLDSVNREMQRPGRFVVMGEMMAVANEAHNGVKYTKLTLRLDNCHLDDTARSRLLGVGNVTIWVRDCTYMKCRAVTVGSVYLIVGNSNGFFDDNRTIGSLAAKQTIQPNYLMHDGDLIDGGVAPGQGGTCGDVLKELQWTLKSRTCF